MMCFASLAGLTEASLKRGVKFTAQRKSQSVASSLGVGNLHLAAKRHERTRAVAAYEGCFG